MTDALRRRRQNALDELEKLIIDNREFPITYNHYYTDIIQKRQASRMLEALNQAVDLATTRTHDPDCFSNHMSTKVDTAAVVTQIYPRVNHNMVHYSCEHLLDCTVSIYKVSSVSGEAKLTSTTNPSVRTK